MPLMSINAPPGAVSAALAAAQRGHAARAAQQHHQQQQAAHFAAQRQQQQSAMLSAAAAQIPPRPEMLFRPEPVREEETAELERMGVPVMVACQRLMTDPALFELVDALRAVTVLRRRQIEAAWASLRREHGARLAALDARAGGAPGAQLERASLQQHYDRDALELERRTVSELQLLLTQVQATLQTAGVPMLRQSAAPAEVEQQRKIVRAIQATHLVRLRQQQQQLAMRTY